MTAPIRPALIDESSDPSLRHILGAALASATSADFAIRRIRLARIDLSAAELGPIRSCRVLVGRLDAGALHDLPHDRAGSHAEAIRRLLRFARSGRLAVRVAPTSGWNPDFSVLQLHTADEPSSGNGCCLVGSHYFQEPDPPEGPAFTGVFIDADAVHTARRRFDLLWDAGYDVLPAVIDALDSLSRDLP